MRISLLSFCLLASSGLLACADTFKLPENKPIVSFALPDSWNPTTTEAGMQAASVDGEIYIAVEFIDSDSMSDVLDADSAFFKEQGVTIDGKQKAEPESTVNGMVIHTNNFNGTEKDGPCEISISVISVAGPAGLMITYWGSPGAADKHKDSLEKILKSIAKI
jgi:hypothetical protein